MVVDLGVCASRYLRAEMKRRDVTYEDLASRLKGIGCDDTSAAVGAKLSRARFSTAFFLACLQVLGCESVALKDVMSWGPSAAKD